MARRMTTGPRLRSEEECDLVRQYLKDEIQTLPGGLQKALARQEIELRADGKLYYDGKEWMSRPRAIATAERLARNYLRECPEATQKAFFDYVRIDQNTPTTRAICENAFKQCQQTTQTVEERQGEPSNNRAPSTSLRNVEPPDSENREITEQDGDKSFVTAQQEQTSEKLKADNVQGVKVHHEPCLDIHHEDNQVASEFPRSLMNKVEVVAGMNDIGNSIWSATSSSSWEPDAVIESDGAEPVLPEEEKDLLLLDDEAYKKMIRKIPGGEKMVRRCYSNRTVWSTYSIYKRRRVGRGGRASPYPGSRPRGRGCSRGRRRRRDASEQ